MNGFFAGLFRGDCRLPGAGDDVHGGDRRGPVVPRTAADDPFPPEVPAVVVRLEPWAAEVRQPGRHPPCPDEGRLPLSGRAPVGSLDYPYPDAERDLNRWLPLVKWFLAIPHYIVLFFLDIGLVVIVIVAWFAILFTGRYPRGMFDCVQGVIRWHIRVVAYAFVLVTDRYPPFSLQP